MGGKLLSMKGLFYMALVAALLYYGWPIIETLIVLSPIPDPKDLKAGAKNVLTTIKGKIAGVGSEGRQAGVDYQSGFDKGPDTLADDDEDDEDVGRDFSQSKDLNYDSDEKDEFGNSEQTELVSLDSGKRNDSAKKNVPKLKGPSAKV